MSPPGSPRLLAGEGGVDDGNRGRRCLERHINYRYTANEIRYLLDNADIVAVVTEQQFAATVAEAGAETPRMQHTLVVDSSYEDALVGSRPDRDFEQRSGEDRYILYTGGTTGQPKGVIWRH